MRALVASAAVSVLAACGPIDARREALAHASARGAIVGGQEAPNDAAVFMLLGTANTGATSTCSATLIGQRTLLTAGHCLDPRALNATSMVVEAMNKPRLGQATAADKYLVVESAVHPRFSTQTLDNDIALALLDRAPPVAPIPWNRLSVSTFTGRPLRALGYGTLGGPSGAGDGVRRSVDLTFRVLTSKLIRLGDQVGRGVCHGDSGGPSLHVFSDAVPRVVGVHSYTLTEACTDGADTRVDTNADFILSWLEAHEPPSCADDGRCVTGCAVSDLDCVCADDGRCTAECPQLDRDPDCPPHCVGDEICEPQDCPRPDPDCVPEGGPCAVASQCRFAQCLSDPQHASAYCSRRCTPSEACPHGMACDGTGLCRWEQLPMREVGEACTPGEHSCGPVAYCLKTEWEMGATCRAACVQRSECGPDQVCAGHDGGPTVCRPPSPIVLPVASAESKPPRVCAVAPAGGLFWASLALLSAWARARQRSRRHHA